MVQNTGCHTPALPCKSTPLLSRARATSASPPQHQHHAVGQRHPLQNHRTEIPYVVEVQQISLKKDFTFAQKI